MKDLIVFDCERMKHPNVGLYFFCKQLANNLITEAASRRQNLALYVPKALKGNWGSDVQYKVVSPLHKLFLPCSPQIKVWHISNQMSSYIPHGPQIILTVHDLNFIYEKNPHKQKKYLQRLQRNVNYASEIVTISEFTKQELLQHIDIQGKPISVIYNGCNIYQGAPQCPDPKPKEEFLFSIGTVLPKKNFHVLPRLLRDNSYELIIAGIKSDYEKRIMQEAELEGVSNRVHIIGTITEAEKHWYLQNCKAFVFPSLAEGFGLPVIEAMYYQKPIFLSPYTCLPEIGKQFAYYFDKEFRGDIMREQLKRGLIDFEKKDTTAQRQYALHFSWKTAATAYWDIYQKYL